MFSQPVPLSNSFSKKTRLAGENDRTAKASARRLSAWCWRLTSRDLIRGACVQVRDLCPDAVKSQPAPARRAVVPDWRNTAEGCSWAGAGAGRRSPHTAARPWRTSRVGHLPTRGVDAHSAAGNAARCRDRKEVAVPGGQENSSVDHLSISGGGPVYLSRDGSILASVKAELPFSPRIAPLGGPAMPSGTLWPPVCTVVLL